MKKQHCNPRRRQAAHLGLHSATAAPRSGSGDPARNQGTLVPRPQKNQLRETHRSCPSLRGRPLPSTVWPVLCRCKTAPALKGFFLVNEIQPSKSSGNKHIFYKKQVTDFFLRSYNYDLVVTKYQ